jgi:hypothetical protein
MHASKTEKQRHNQMQPKKRAGTHPITMLPHARNILYVSIYGLQVPMINSKHK